MNTIQKSLQNAKEGASRRNLAKGSEKREQGSSKEVSKKTECHIKEIKRRREPKITGRKIKYFMLKPKAKALHYLQPGEIIGVKVGDKWVQFTLLERERLSYKESSLLWMMINEDGEVLTRYLSPADEWVVLYKIYYLLDTEHKGSKLQAARVHT